MAKPEFPWAENDIRIIAGSTKLLLIAPHGVATKPRDDINTDQLTFRIAERLKCSAIVNDVLSGRIWTLTILVMHQPMKHLFRPFLRS